MLKNKIQDEFKNMVQIGKISCNLLHDLISPFTGLSLYLENIQDKKMRDLLTPINETNAEIRRFIQLIQETIKHPNQIDIVNIREIIEHVIILTKHQTIKNNISIIYACNTLNVLVVANKLEIYQIILNLINNAVDALENKITDKKVITISLSESIFGLRLTIADNGTGIKKRILKKIFNVNFTTKKNGLGLGLYGVRKIVEQKIKGKIIVKSHFGKGTKFHIFIPKRIIISSKK
jgi:signal transduction histidine kinase